MDKITSVESSNNKSDDTKTNITNKNKPVKELSWDDIKRMMRGYVRPDDSDDNDISHYRSDFE